mgnify:CR=1 FL=1
MLKPPKSVISATGRKVSTFRHAPASYRRLCRVSQQPSCTVKSFSARLIPAIGTVCLCRSMLLYVIVVIDFVVNTLVQYHEQVVRFGLSLFGPATHIIQRFAGCDQIFIGHGPAQLRVRQTRP